MLTYTVPLPYSVMVEGSGEEVPEDMICEAVHFALSEVRAYKLLETTGRSYDYCRDVYFVVRKSQETCMVHIHVMIDCIDVPGPTSARVTL